MNQFNKILCLVEPESNSEAALSQALRIASDHQAEVTFASILRISSAKKYCFNNDKQFDYELSKPADLKRKAVKNWINKIDPKLSINIEIFIGIGFIEVVKNVLEEKYDLVVKCADEVDWLDRLFGSEDMHLIRKCPCPVLMLKPGQIRNFKNVLATVDLNDEQNDRDELENNANEQSALNDKVLEYSSVFSVSQSTELHIGCAWEAYGEDFLRYGAFSNTPVAKIDRYTEDKRLVYSNKMDALVTKMNDIVGKDAVDYMQPQIHLVKAQAAKAIPIMVKQYNIDLLVMGTVARTGIPGFIFGNTAEAVLEQVQCSVLAIKPTGFITPVQS
jgi:nucleotide-binding universal stress UspA family protein